MSANHPLLRVSAEILNRPIMVTPRHATVILSAMRSRLNIKLVEQIEGMPLDQVAMEAVLSDARMAADTRRGAQRRTGGNDRKPFAFVDGIAIIPISGTLMKNWGLEPYSGSTGYDGIKAKLIAAMNDDDVRAIYLDIDSPGGVVSGCFDLCDLIFACNERNGGKPIWGLANEQACSAAYAIGASCDKLYLPRTGEVGSIGVLWIYSNVEEALAQEGVKVTLFRSGKHKAEGNSVETMGEDTAARIQAELDEMRELFISTVARGRGLRKKPVRDTEALTYMGKHATDNVLADGVLSEDQFWARMQQRYGR